MLCTLSGILWARMANRRVHIDWCDGAYSPEGENAFDNLFVIADTEKAAFPVKGEVMPEVWDGRIERSVSSMLHEFDPKSHSSLRVHRKYSIDPSRLDYDQPTVVFWYYMDRFASMRRLMERNLPDYAGLKRSEIIARGLRTEMLLHPSIRSRVDEFKSKKWDHPIIGVHVRQSDRKGSIRKALTGAKRLLGKSKDASLFLATDNAAVEAEFRARFKQVIVTPKWFPDVGMSMHQSIACVDKLANGIEALVDMYLLAECDSLVYSSRSTFSYISACLSIAKEEFVIDLDRKSPVIQGKALIRRVCV